MSITNAPASAPAILMIGTGAQHLPIPATTNVLLVNSILLTANLVTDVAGTISLPGTLPADPGIAGAKIYLQALSQDGLGIMKASNGLELDVCP